VVNVFFLLLFSDGCDGHDVHDDVYGEPRRGVDNRRFEKDALIFNQPIKTGCPITDSLFSCFFN
jgi:hypothetical protein